MEFENFSIPLPNCKNTRRQIMSKINTSCVKNDPKAYLTELTNSELGEVWGGGGVEPVGGGGSSGSGAPRTSSYKEMAIIQKMLELLMKLQK
jgi:hypothetical protein